MPQRRVVRHEVVQPQNQSFRFIPLTKKQNAIVDIEDFERISRLNWYAMWNRGAKQFYAANKTRGRGTILMHRMILRCKKKEEVDHKNHDTLDNRKENLRKCKHFQNACHKRKSAINTSGFKGVSWHDGRWRARIQINGRTIPIGRFRNAADAALAYNKKAKEIHGEFAVLNHL